MLLRPFFSNRLGIRCGHLSHELDSHLTIEQRVNQILEKTPLIGENTDVATCCQVYGRLDANSMKMDTMISPF